MSEFRLEAAKDDGDFQPVRIESAEANYEQKNYPVTAAIDGQTGRGGWAVDGNTRFADSTAVFRLADAIEPGMQVRVYLQHTWGGSHTIGRFRLSVQSDGNALIPPAIREIATLDPSSRDDDKKSKLSRYLAERFGGKTIAKLGSDLRTLKERRDRANKSIPDTMVLSEMPKPRPTYVLMRGEYDKPITERKVQPNIPGVLGGLPDDSPKNRLGLAQWLVSRDNPLTARVTVNRFWAQLFGVGLVKTIEDFGSQGEYPSHPELLDWLAVEFMESGWDVKHLFRTIVTSRTYRQSSHLSPESTTPATRRTDSLREGHGIDLTPKSFAILRCQSAACWIQAARRPECLSLSPVRGFGWRSTIAPAILACVSAYQGPQRALSPQPVHLLEAYRSATQHGMRSMHRNVNSVMVQRSRTNTPLQAFVLLHDPQFVEAARKLGERMIVDADNADS